MAKEESVWMNTSHHHISINECIVLLRLQTTHYTFTWLPPNILWPDKKRREFIRPDYKEHNSVLIGLAVCGMLFVLVFFGEKISTKQLSIARVPSTLSTRPVRLKWEKFAWKDTHFRRFLWNFLWPKNV